MSSVEAHKFDPQGQVTFDLPLGQVHLDGAPTRVMVPADALVALCEAAGPVQVAALGRKMGEAAGRRIRTRLGTDGSDVGARQKAVQSAPFELILEHLAGELALLGLGVVGAERWGRALVLVVEGSPLSPQADGGGEAAGEEVVGDTLVAEVLSSALEAATGQIAKLVRLQRDGDKARFAVLAPGAAERVRAMLGAGQDWSNVLATLQTGGAS